MSGLIQKLFVQSGAGSVPRDLQAKLRERYVSLEDKGAQGGAVDDTGAFQDSLDELASRGGGMLYVPDMHLIDFSALAWPAIDAVRVVGDPHRSGFKAVDAEPMLRITGQAYGLVFEDLIFDTDSLATYGVYMASNGVFASVKNTRFINAYVKNLKAGAVGWQIGDQTNTGLDTDAWNYNFFSCHARGANGSIGWVVDANNAYNIGWFNCSAGRKAVGQEMLTWIKTIRGSGYRLYNFFGDLLQAGGSPWGIDHGGGSLSVYGLSTEDHRVIRGRSAGQADSQVFMCDVSVNDDSGAGGTSVDTDMNTELRNAKLGTNTYPRKIICSADFTGNNVSIGGTGGYELSSDRRCSLEGLPVGTLKNPVQNGLFNLWRGAAVDDAPLGWSKNADGGTLTIQQSTANALTGKYTVDVTVTAGATAGTANRVAGLAMSSSLDVSAYRGQRVAFFAIGTRNAAEEIQMDVKIDGGAAEVGGGNVINDGSRFFCYGYADIGAAESSASIKIGLGVGTTGRFWLDCVGVAPTDWSEYVPALYQHAQHQTADIQADYLNAGYVPLGRLGFRVVGLGIAAPTGGTWEQGDVVLNQAAAAGGYIGWVCTTAGSPGTWKTFGAISV